MWKEGVYHIVLTPSKTSPDILLTIVVEKQQKPDIKKTDLKEEKSWLQRTLEI